MNRRQIQILKSCEDLYCMYFEISDFRSNRTIETNKNEFNCVSPNHLYSWNFLETLFFCFRSCVHFLSKGTTVQALEFTLAYSSQIKIVPFGGRLALPNAGKGIKVDAHSCLYLYRTCRTLLSASSALSCNIINYCIAADILKGKICMCNINLW